LTLGAAAAYHRAMPTGADLIADIDAFRPDAGRFAFWWLGQQGFALKMATETGAAVIYVDAYLSDSKARTVPPVVAPGEVTNADLILGTHDHSDHIDRGAWPAIAAASPGAVFVVPELHAEKLAGDLGLPRERLLGLDDGRSAELSGVKVSAVASAHEFLDPDAKTGLHPYLGYVIETEEFTVYHAGDTCRYEGLWGRLSKWILDLAFLPINGRDARRLRANCIGNMTYQEAADLAGDLTVGLTVPGHYEMFESNSEDVDLFVDYMRVKYPELAVVAPAHGERVVVPVDRIEGGS